MAMDAYLQSGNIEDPGVDSLKHWTILCYVSPRTISIIKDMDCSIDTIFDDITTTTNKQKITTTTRTE